jgi:hypothetical protein
MNDTIHQDKPNPELIKMIGYGHEKERKMADMIFDASYDKGLEPLIKTLSMLTETALSQVINTIVRQTKAKKAELEAKKKK